MVPTNPQQKYCMFENYLKLFEAKLRLEDKCIAWPTSKELYMTRCDIRVTFAGNEILWSKVLLKFVCLVYNAVQFNPQVISFSTMYNSPYKISTKNFFFVFS